MPEQDTKPIAQNQFITDLWAFESYGDLPEVIVTIFLMLRMKASQQICNLCPKLTRLTNTAKRLVKGGKAARSTHKAANQWRKNASMGRWKCVRNFSIY